jgi:hypothetical protein
MQADVASILHLRTPDANVTAYTDGIITNRDGQAVFLSILGTDSAIKACSGHFLDSRHSRRDYGSGLWAKPEGKHKFMVRRDNTADYRVITSKLTDNASHQIICDARFLPGLNIEKNARLLALRPGQDAASETWKLIHREIATPALDAWGPTIYQELLENWNRHQTEPSRLEYQARCKVIPAKLGEISAVVLRITEESFDALISALISQGRVEF